MTKAMEVKDDDAAENGGCAVIIDSLVVPSQQQQQQQRNITTTDTIHNIPIPTPPSMKGLRVVLGFFYFHLLLVSFPSWSYFQYDVVATTYHLEEPRGIADEAVVQTNRAIGLVNIILVIPLNILAIVGLSIPLFSYQPQQQYQQQQRRRQHDTNNNNDLRGTIQQQQQPQHPRPSPPSPPPPVSVPLWGMLSSYLLLGIALYWPVLFLATRCTYTSASIGHIPLGPSDVITVTLVLLLSLWSTMHLSTHTGYNTRIAIGTDWEYSVHNSIAVSPVGIVGGITDHRQQDENSSGNFSTQAIERQSLLPPNGNYGSVPATTTTTTTTY
jgi:hypothetical protein